MKTKQLLAVLTAALLVLGLFSACTAKKNENETQTGPVLPTPEQRPGESTESQNASGTQSPDGSGEDPAATGAPGESGSQDSGEEGKDGPESGSASNPGGSSSNPGGSASNPGGSSAGAETDEDLYHVEPDTDDSDENLG